jgi:hypothetical protein
MSSDPPFSEPTGEWDDRPAYKVVSGDYVLDSRGERLKVLASYAGVGGASASATLWYVEAYCHGSPTRRLGSSPEDLVMVEVPA